MKDILALDLGTNSIGWAIREPHLNDADQYTHFGVRIFSKGVGEGKTGEFSLASVRTTKRSLRKIYRRRRTRKIRLLRLLIANGMCPLTNSELKLWAEPQKGELPIYPQTKAFRDWVALDPYEMRARAASFSERLQPMQVGRALYHLCQRRGFKSNAEDEKEDTTPKDKAIYDKWVEENPGLTVGQALFKVLQEAKATNKYARVRGSGRGNDDDDKATKATENAEDEPGTSYASRFLYQAEFWQICKSQQIGEALAKQLGGEIFHQRPLKGQKGTVGKCKLEPAKTRCPLSHPDYEEFRMWQFLNNVRYWPKGESKENAQPLTAEMKALILPKFQRKENSFPFSDLSSTINKASFKAAGIEYNFNYSENTSVPGCPTIAELKSWREDWRTAKTAYEPTGEFENEKNGTVTWEDVWHIWLTLGKEPEKIVAFARRRLGIIDEKELKKFVASKSHIKQGYSDLSLKAIRKILPLLQKGLIFSHAVFLANMEAVVGKAIWKSDADFITEQVLKVMEENGLHKKLNNAVNAAISYFNNNYQNAAPDYHLDSRDVSELTERLVSNFGQKNWEAMTIKQQTELLDKAKQLYEQQLGAGFKNASFLKSTTIEEDIMAFLADNFDVSVKQLEKLYHPSIVEVFEQAKKVNDVIVPGSPRTASVRNPMVMRTLFELRHLLKELFQKQLIDEETVVVVEMARELNDANKRKAIKEWQDKRERENETYRKEIFEHFTKHRISRLPQPADIQKYRLWKEQKETCIYTGKQIGIADLFNGELFDLEHSFPRSKTNDNSLENLTVSDSNFNRNVKKNRSPFELYEAGILDKEALLQRISHWKDEISKQEYLVYKRQAPKGWETKETKDRRIKERHKFKMELNYWRSKYERFTATEIRPGFANSQLVDTGIITKYALAYLRSMFEQVRAVKGSIVAEFRKAWGLQDDYEKKSRENHLHHLVDAMVIAALDRSKYDLLAQLYTAEERMNRRESDELKQKLLPWKGFGEDVKQLVSNTLVSHAHRDKFTTQTKRKLRVRGKIVRKADGEAVVLQGQGARARLHQDTYYGAILRPDSDKPKYVIRKSVVGLKSTDYDKIVDEYLRNSIKSGALKVFPEKGCAFWVKANGEPDDSKPPILKLRMFASVSNPLKLKTQSHWKNGDGQEHKRHYYVANEGNYELLVFQRQHNGKVDRKVVPVNYLEASNQYIKQRDMPNGNMVLPDSTKYEFYARLRIDSLVLCYETNQNEIKWNDPNDLAKRLYQIKGMESDGRITLKYHKEARNDDALREQLKFQLGAAFEDNWVKGRPKFEASRQYPKLRLSPGNFNFIVSGTHFTISSAGEIKAKY